MSKRNWSDQPEQCERAEILWTVSVGDGRIVEIRRMPEEYRAPEEQHLFNREYLVTVGSLFGSETIQCYGEDKLFEVLRLTNRASKGRADIPTGVRILGNAQG